MCSYIYCILKRDNFSTVYCSLRTTEEEENAVNFLFSQLGLCEKIPESLMSAGSLSGCGPAFVC